MIVVALLAAAVGAAWLCRFSSRAGGAQVSVRFLGYTNAGYGPRVGMVQVSNGSSFAVVRGRSPAIDFDSPGAPRSYAPTGWNLLQPGEGEEVMTEPLTNGLRWRVTVACDRPGDDPYGIGPEPAVRVRVRQVAAWLQGHGIPASSPSPPPTAHFSSDWIEP